MKFKGDIIITDPCYVIKDDDWNGLDTDYSSLGFTNFLVQSTQYGDWSCTTIDLNTGKPIGRFCADAGLVCVLLLEEVLKHNPDFNYHLERNWTTTWIKDFDGDVEIEFFEEKYMYNGVLKSDTAVKVVGKGNINFETRQTGF